jgi:hypothetical protein
VTSLQLVIRIKLGRFIRKGSFMNACRVPSRPNSYWWFGALCSAPYNSIKANFLPFCATLVTELKRKRRKSPKQGTSLRTYVKQSAHQCDVFTDCHATLAMTKETFAESSIKFYNRKIIIFSDSLVQKKSLMYTIFIRMKNIFVIRFTFNL